MTTAEMLTKSFVPNSEVRYEALSENDFAPTPMPYDQVTGLQHPTVPAMIPPCNPVTGLPMAYEKETKMRKTELKSMIQEMARDESRYGTNYVSHDKHTNDTAKRLRAQLAGEDKYKKMLNEDHSFVGTMTEEEIINENLNYFLYGSNSKLGKHLAKLQHDLAELDRQGLQTLRYYPIVKRRVNKFKTALHEMEAQI